MRNLFGLGVAGALMMSACTSGQRDTSIQTFLVSEDVSIEKMVESVHTQLEGQVVGYAFVVGADPSFAGSGGLGRTQADDDPIAFTSDTQMIVASVSKWVTAIAVMSVLDENNVSLDSAIGPYFPADWTIVPYVQSITFAQLLRQTSGIKDSGNGTKSYQKLQAFFTQPVDAAATARCGAPANDSRANRITPNNLDFCYSNYNAAILRVLLPKLANLPEDMNIETRSQTLAHQYEQIVRDKVFSPVGVTGVGCAPVGDTFALSYIFPGDKAGQDWGPQYDRCAAGGWYLSAEDLAKVASSLVNRDGKILRETATYSSFREMREQRLGLDRSWPHLIEKGGLLGEDAGVLSTSVVIFQPDSVAPIPAILFINSTGADGSIVKAREVLETAYKYATPSHEADE